MAFVKLDCNILDSSIWIDKPARDVFITALLMAFPRVLEHPTETIKTDSLEPDPFVVPAGEYGLVPAAGVGIIDRAGLDIATGRAALARLASDETDSRSQEFGGRRMVRINGGYIILNFRRYRDKDHTAAARQARYRLKKVAAIAAPPSRSSVTRNVTQGRGHRAEGRGKKSKRETQGGVGGPG